MIFSLLICTGALLYTVNAQGNLLTDCFNKQSPCSVDDSQFPPYNTFLATTEDSCKSACITQNDKGILVSNQGKLEIKFCKLAVFKSGVCKLYYQDGISLGSGSGSSGSSGGSGNYQGRFARQAGYGGQSPPVAPVGGYGAPPSVPSGGYGSPPAPVPSAGGYGGQSAPVAPVGGYGAPPSVPSGGYGAPPSVPSGGYGAPPSVPSGGYGSPPAPVPSAGGYGGQSAPVAPAQSGYGGDQQQQQGGYGGAAPPTSGGYGGDQGGFGGQQGGYGGSQPSGGYGGSQPSGGYGGNQPSSGYGGQQGGNFGNNNNNNNGPATCYQVKALCAGSGANNTGGAPATNGTSDCFLPKANKQLDGNAQTFLQAPTDFDGTAADCKKKCQADTKCNSLNFYPAGADATADPAQCVLHDLKCSDTGNPAVVCEDRTDTEYYEKNNCKP